MANKKNSFILYFDQAEMLEALSDEQRGRVFSAIFQYAETGKLPELNQAENIAFLSIKQAIDRDCEKYEKTCRKNAENASLRWDRENANACECIKEDTNACERIKEDAKHADSDNDSDSDSENPPKSPQGEKRTEALAMNRRFDSFWEAYPKKAGKAAARKAFLKHKPGDVLLAAMLKAIEAQKRSDQWMRDGGQYIPYPATWLNGERWNDELPQARGKPENPALDYGQREYSAEDIAARIYDPTEDPTFTQLCAAEDAP